MEKKSSFHFSCQKKIYFKIKTNILTELKFFKMTHDVLNELQTVGLLTFGVTVSRCSP